VPNPTNMNTDFWTGISSMLAHTSARCVHVGRMLARVDFRPDIMRLLLADLTDADLRETMLSYDAGGSQDNPYIDQRTQTVLARVFLPAKVSTFPATWVRACLRRNPILLWMMHALRPTYIRSAFTASERQQATNVDIDNWYPGAPFIDTLAFVMFAELYEDFTSNDTAPDDQEHSDDLMRNDYDNIMWNGHLRTVNLYR
jgi:hypothetical protein